MSERPRSWSGPAFAAAVAAAALAALLAKAALLPELPLHHDPLQYHTGAVNLLAGRGYVHYWAPSRPRVFGTADLHAFFPVGYPAFLAGLYALTGPRPAAALVANAVLLAAAVALTHAVGRRLAGERAARAAALVLALLALTTRMSQTAYAEPLFLTLVLASVGLWLWRPAWPWQVGSGLALGLAHLVRPVSLLLPAAYFVLGVLLRESWGRAAARAAVVGGVSLLVVAPWTVRNWRRFGRLVLVSTNGGLNLWIGNHPGASGGYHWPPIPADVAAAKDEAAWDQRARRHALAAILARPGRFLARLPAKLSHTVGFGFVHAGAVRREGRTKVVLRAVVSALTALVLLGTAAQGAWALARRVRHRTEAAGRALVPPLLAAYFLAFPLVFHGSRRFLYPAYPFMALSVAILWAWATARCPEQRAAPAPGRGARA